MKKVLLAMLVCCGGLGLQAQTTHVVSAMANLTYSPDTVNAEIGDTVRFVYVGGTLHPTQSTETPAWFPAFDLSANDPDGIVLCSTSGTHGYKCTVHQPNMKGVIIVAPPTPPIGVGESPAFELQTELRPNPTSGNTTIFLNGVQASRVEVLDATGRLASSEAVNAGMTRLDLSLSELPNGVYFVRVMSNSNVVETQRLVLSK